MEQRKKAALERGLEELFRPTRCREKTTSEVQLAPE
jgi:hypothetical protein